MSCDHCHFTQLKTLIDDKKRNLTFKSQTEGEIGKRVMFSLKGAFLDNAWLAASCPINFPALSIVIKIGAEASNAIGRFNKLATGSCPFSAIGNPVMDNDNPVDYHYPRYLFF